MLPILMFFTFFKLFDIYWATLSAIATSCSQIGLTIIRGKRPEMMTIVTFLMILVLGGATLILRNEIFIKWKPTAVYWLLSLGFLISQFIGQKPFVKRMMEKSLTLPDVLWTKLNLSWVAFFMMMGGLNLYVVYNYDTETWVNFKLFGSLILTLLFVVGQGLVLAKHLPTDENSQKP